jgi:hypothetical protein
MMTWWLRHFSGDEVEHLWWWGAVAFEAGLIYAFVVRW